MTQLKWGEALEQGERAVELDPLSVAAILDLVHVCFHVRDFGRALGLTRRAASLDPGYPWVHFFLMLIYVEMNMPEEARRAAAVWVELVQGDYPLARMGADFNIAVHEKDKETVARLVPECTSHFLEAGLSAWFVAVGFFCIGERDKGFDWLERSYSRREPLLMEIKNEQSLNSVRTDQRYLDLLKRLGLA